MYTSGLINCKHTVDKILKQRKNRGNLWFAVSYRYLDGGLSEHSDWFGSDHTHFDWLTGCCHCAVSRAVSQSYKIYSTIIMLSTWKIPYIHYIHYWPTVWYYLVNIPRHIRAKFHVYAIRRQNKQENILQMPRRFEHFRGFSSSLIVSEIKATLTNIRSPLKCKKDKIN